jgi:hypothetical protein
MAHTTKRVGAGILLDLAVSASSNYRGKKGAFLIKVWFKGGAGASK